jgi:hypothetical protein
MSTLSKYETVVHQVGEPVIAEPRGKNPHASEIVAVSFASEEATEYGCVHLEMDAQSWKDMGNPATLTVAVVPGNALEERNEIVEESRYAEALSILRAKVDALHGLMHDPFKAPELTIAEIPDVQRAMWEAQVEYAAMRRANN